VEDGYGVLEQKINAAKGTPHPFYLALSKFYGKYYPEPMWKSASVQYIISSLEYLGDDAYYRGKVRVIDFHDLVNQNKGKFVETIKALFDLDEMEIPAQSALILSQPLARAKYCTIVEYYLFIRKIIRMEQANGHAVYIKPHPADNLNMKLFMHDGVVVLPMNMPSEVLNYVDVKFAKGYSFNSTSIGTCEFLESYELLYKGTAHTYEDFKSSIKNFVRGEKLIVDYYVKAREFTARNYANIIGYHKDHKYFQARINVVVEASEFDEGRRYFAPENARATLIKYFRAGRKNGEPVGWKDELKHAARVARLRLISAPALDDMSLFQILASEDRTSDFVLIVDACEDGRTVREAVHRLLAKRMRQGFFFFNYTYKSGEKHQLGFGIAGRACTVQLSNRLWSRRLVEKISACDANSAEIYKVLFEYAPSLAVSARLNLYCAPEHYTRIDDGRAYYYDAFGRLAAAYADVYDDPEDRDNFIGMTAAIVCAEYYNWRLVTSNYDIAMRFKEFVDEFNIADEHKMIALQTLSSFYIGSGRVLANHIKHDSYAQYAQPAVRWLSRVGVIDMLLFLRKVLRRLRFTNKITHINK
jgi:hypothetical protein